MTRRAVILFAALAAPACSLDAAGLGASMLDDASTGDGLVTFDADDSTLPPDEGIEVEADSGEPGDADPTDGAVETIDASDADAVVAIDALDAADAPDAPDATDAADVLFGDGDTCGDLLLDGDESDVDCGGHCAKCGTGYRCHGAADCGSGACSALGVCTVADCTNGALDPGEADVDCGVACAKGCAVGRACGSAADCGGRLCVAGKCALALSCDEIFAGDPTAPTGAYPLRSARTGATSPWTAYCAMVGSGVDIGGWTLTLKASRGSPTFAFEAAAWSDQSLLPGTPDLAPGEAKFEGFLSIPVHALRVGFAPGAASPARWLVLALPSSGLPTGLTYPPASLASIFANGKFVPTAALGRDAWLGALPGSSLQKNCNREGLGLVAGALSVRIGILANEQGNCDTPDSRIGVGGAGSTCGTDASNRHGDVCGCGCYDASGASVTSANVLAQTFVFVR